MKRRTLIILVAVAAVLGAFIWFVERGSLSSTELEGRRGRLLQRFVRPRVERLEIQRRNAKTVLVRERPETEDPEDELSVGTWKLEAPVRAEVDDDAVESLLNAMEWADSRRTIEGVTTEDRERFGLDRPRIRAWFTAGHDRIPITIGREAPSGEGVYAQLDDPDVAYVVGKDFFEAFDHDADHFRSKALFSGFDVTRATAITLSGEGGERRLEKEGERWHLRRPVDAPASQPDVEDVLSALDEIRAARFVAERASDLARYGLDRPWREMRAERTGGDDDDEPDAGPPAPTSIRLRIGRVCAGHADERYALAGDRGPVACVATSALELLGRSANELRERRVVTAEDEDIEKLTLVAGARRLEVTREGETWTYTARPTGSGEADDEAIAAWTEALRELRATGFARSGEARLLADGLARPASTLTIARSGDAPDEVIHLGTVRGEVLPARRGQEGWVIELPASARELFDPTPVRLRERRVLRLQDGDIQVLMLRRGAVTEEIAREGEVWRIIAPRAGDPDRSSVRELVRRLGSLEAVRWVSEAPEPAHGLAAPRVLITIRARDGAATHDHHLKIGAVTEGGAYAQLENGAVFVAPTELVDLADAPLLSRNLLQTDPEQVSRISINTGGASRPAVMRREGTTWIAGAAEGPGPAPDGERMQRLLDRLAALRASDIEVDTPSDLGTRTTVDITRIPTAAEPRSYGFDILAGELTTGDTPRMRVRLRHPSAPGVVYLFPTDVMQTFIDFQP